MSHVDGITGTFLTGLLGWRGEPIPLCVHDCACGKHCERNDGHPADDYRHVCAGCADIWIEVQS